VLHESYDALVIFKVNNLEEHNKAYGWKAGNSVLKKYW